ncbi:hypothetical protein BH24ACI4_BH24ACI4_13310 [soil metagenome]
MPALIKNGPRPLEPEAERPRTPHATLATQVLLLALLDLHSLTECDRLSAERFFFGDADVSLLMFWCAVLGWDADALREGVRRQQREGRTFERLRGRIRWIPTAEESFAAAG